jgi:NAD(P)-dependent dehydrogenase (short-subunit alcohol dehydrogenase family)
MDNSPSMTGKVVVMTGATSGIGLIAAEHLASRGARLILIARDEVRGTVVLDRLRKCAPDPGHRIHYADLSRLGEVKRTALRIAAAEPRIHVIINNAGAIFARRSITPDGLEQTFALNHMSYFVLTEGLGERLVAAAPSRIVNTASNAHRNGHLDPDNLQGQKTYSPAKAYGTSKLCNILFTRELARRLAGKGVTANCYSPGFVATRFGNEAGGLTGPALRVGKLFAQSPEAGARTLIYLVTSPEVAETSGEYFYRCSPGKLTAEARCDAASRRLWAESERIMYGRADPAVVNADQAAVLTEKDVSSLNT